jgi:hypothetical protein
MIDFDRWFSRPLVAPNSAEAHIAGLEAQGIIHQITDKTFQARCCRCEQWTELPVGPEEIDLDYEHYCGGSPRCCP